MSDLRNYVIRENINKIEGLDKVINIVEKKSLTSKITNSLAQAKVGNKSENYN